ncbi:MAG: polymerase beta domain protein, partial [Candidatus Gottesmanbacteria bacterium GW2011_GWA1_44_24b]
QKQDRNTRVAILPQPSYWSWKLYDFGYRGSGFFWYGIPQPTLDRAFDPWSNENENYFWELSYAIYKKDPLLLNNVFSKYNVGYVVFDEEFLATAGHYRALFIEETKELLSQMPGVTKVAEFGKITIYHRTNMTYTTYVTTKNNLPVVSPQYNSLFTKRNVDEREFRVKETSDDIVISSTTVSDVIPFSINKNQALVFDSEKDGVIDPKNTIACYPYKNGVVKATLESDPATYLRLQATDNRLCLNFGMPELWHKDGYLVAVTSKHIQGRPLTFSLINKTAKHTEMETQLDTANIYKNETGAWRTDYFILPPLSTDGKGYDVYIANDAIGRQTTINDIASVRVYTIPYEEMVTMKIQSDKETEIQSDNTSLTIESVEHPNPAYYKIKIMENGEWKMENTALILSQSFDKGWKAYTINTNNPIIKLSNYPIKTKLFETFPFLFGKEIKEHVLINNWSNGWVIQMGNGEWKMENNELITSTLEQQKSALRQFGVSRIGLFGSSVRADATPESDIDMVVEFDPGKKTYKNFFGTATYLESLFKKQVDLVTPQAISPRMKPYIDKDIQYVQISD